MRALTVIVFLNHQDVQLHPIVQPAQYDLLTQSGPKCFRTRCAISAWMDSHLVLWLDSKAKLGLDYVDAVPAH